MRDSIPSNWFSWLMPIKKPEIIRNACKLDGDCGKNDNPDGRCINGKCMYSKAPKTPLLARPENNMKPCIPEKGEKDD